MRVFVVFPGALVASRVDFCRAVAVGIVFIFRGSFERVCDALEVLVGVVFVCCGLSRFAWCRPGDRFGVTVTVAFDRRRLTIGCCGGDYVMGGVVGPLRTVSESVGFYRAISCLVVPIPDCVTVGIGDGYEIPGAFVFVGGDLSD